jgi:DNA-binding NarL/FixJ family response regulator
VCYPTRSSTTTGAHRARHVRRDRHAGVRRAARRELLASGETVGTRTADLHDQLTPQEVPLVRLSRAGPSNPEIAAQLFLSPRTVDYHLRKAFTKLDITSRRQLRQALPDSSRDRPVA